MLALDNVRLELPVAGLGSRSLAALVDYFFFALAFIAFGLVAVAVLLWVASFGESGASAAPWLMTGFLLAAFVLNWAFFAVQEIALGGQTLGKRLLRLRVVSRLGGRAAPLALVLRNLLRPLDLLLAVPLMALDPQARRAGDRLAATIVVHEVERLAPSALLEQVPAGLQAEELGLVEELLRRRGELDPDRAEAIADELWRTLTRQAPRLELGEAGTGPLDRLRQLFATPVTAAAPPLAGGEQGEA